VKKCIMASIPHPIPAHALLDILDPPAGQPAVSVAQAEQATLDFIAHLNAVLSQQRRKSWSERYLIEQVFGRTRSFKNDIERQLYCRCHLKVAIEQLSTLVAELRDAATGALTLASVTEWRDTVRDYVFDLLEIVPFLQRNVPGYVYLRGGKNPTVHSWQVYNLAKGLAYQSRHWGRGSALDHKVAQIAAIAVLRQALELRFDRLISVYPTDRKGKSPKLRHGFHRDFVVANPQFFQPDGFSIAELMPMYDWCSEIVHQAYQPFAWQTGWALQLGGRLLGPRSVPSGSAWSIANSVEIIDIQRMQATFETHFLDNYDHGAWRMTRQRPEALVRNWTGAMAFTNPNFQPIHRRQNFLYRLYAHLTRWMRKH
jgi:hypothetical protein